MKTSNWYMGYEHFQLPYILLLVGPWSPLPGKSKSKSKITFFNCLEWEPDINSEFFSCKICTITKIQILSWRMLDPTSTVALYEKKQVLFKGPNKNQSNPVSNLFNSSTSREKMRSKLYLLVVGVLEAICNICERQNGDHFPSFPQFFGMNI